MIQLMQAGYNDLKAGHTEQACEHWWKLWQAIKEVMRTEGPDTMEAFDEELTGGPEPVYNWSSDFDMALANLSDEHSNWAERRLAFCSEYLASSSDKDDYNQWNRRQTIAEMHYKLGDAPKGNELFEAYLKENPEWGWGWMAWSDMYWLFGEPELRDTDRAIHILKQALEHVQEREERTEIMDRLNTLYIERGMTDEADAVSKAQRAMYGEL